MNDHAGGSDATGRMILLSTKRLTKRFGALAAVDGVDLAVEAGGLHAVIGPNGAGKTTLFSLISGELPPSDGRIVFNGVDITRLPAHTRPHLGIGRSFQRTMIFPNLNVYENAWVAAYARAGVRGSHAVRRPADLPEVGDVVARALDQVGLGALARRKGKELSHGEHRLLEVAIALCASPSLLLLDEPTSGLSPEETGRMVSLIRSLRGRYTVLLIEHKMNVVLSISDAISVMHFGRLLAQGTPAEIRANAAVQQAYLGTPR